MIITAGRQNTDHLPSLPHPSRDLPGNKDTRAYGRAWIQTKYGLKTNFNTSLSVTVKAAKRVSSTAVPSPSEMIAMSPYRRCVVGGNSGTRTYRPPLATALGVVLGSLHQLSCDRGLKKRGECRMLSEDDWNSGTEPVGLEPADELLLPERAFGKIPSCYARCTSTFCSCSYPARAFFLKPEHLYMLVYQHCFAGSHTLSFWKESEQLYGFLGPSEARAKVKKNVYGWGGLGNSFRSSLRPRLAGVGHCSNTPFLSRPPTHSLL
jgi:hypothetical protein